VNQRQTEQQSLRVFAERHGLSVPPDGGLPIHGHLDGVALSISKEERGQRRYPWPVTQFLATAPTDIPGGLVAYKPNFRWRFKGDRKISDSLGASGLFGFVHHDPVGDPELDRKLVIYADDVALARSLLTEAEVRRSILETLSSAGHIRIHQSRVAVEVSERRRGVLRLLATAEEVELLARAATGVVRALCAAADALRRSG
jgi:hypothetical protein